MSRGLPQSYPRTYRAARQLVAIPTGSTYAERLPLVLDALRGRTPDELRYLLHQPERVAIDGYSREAPTGHRWLVEVVERDETSLTEVLFDAEALTLRSGSEEHRSESRLRKLATAMVVVTMWGLSAAISVGLLLGIAVWTWELVVGLGAVVGSCRLPPTRDRSDVAVGEVCDR